MKIAVAQRKGGVAKTATTRELAVVLTRMGKSVLVVDCDPQHNLTTHFNTDSKLSLTGLLMTDSEPADAIVTSAYGPDVIASDSRLAQAELGMGSMPDNKTIFAEVLAPVLDSYDFVFFDCPPNLGLLTANAIHASDVILSPVSDDGLDSVGGVVMLRESLDASVRAEMPIVVVETRWSKTRKLSREVHEALVDLGFPILGRIPDRVPMRDAAAYGPVGYRLPDSDSALAYRAIAVELVESEVGAWAASVA